MMQAVQVDTRDLRHGSTTQVLSEKAIRGKSDEQSTKTEEGEKRGERGRSSDRPVAEVCGLRQKRGVSPAFPLAATDGSHRYYNKNISATSKM